MNLTNYDKFKRKHTSIKPEDLILNKEYAFSYNPKEQLGITCIKYTHHKRFINTYHDWVNNMHKLFKKLQGCNICVVLEVSQLGRLHFHGYIRVKNKFLFYVKDIPYLMSLGTIAIVPINEPDEWKKYLCKQEHVFKKTHDHLEADSTYKYSNEKIAISVPKHEFTFS